MLFKGNSSSLQLIIEKLQSNKEHSNTKDTLGSEAASSWVSEDPTTSPDSSCVTPNSATEAPESELSFTVGETATNPHLCRFCDKAFPKLNQLKKHEQTHADCMPFRCEFCLRLFKHKRSRDRHIKLHTGDKKYKCTMCDAAFSRSDHLKIHMKTHDHHKPFQCAACNRGYNTAAALTSHMQNHKRENESAAIQGPPGTSFKCLQCCELFKKPEDLQNHMNSHQLSDTIPRLRGRSRNSNTCSSRLNCPHCTKGNFSSAEALQSHVESVHKSVISVKNTSPQKPIPPLSNFMNSSPQTSNSSPSYICEQCPMKFSSLPSLQKHTGSVHGNTKYPMNMMPDNINNDKLFCTYCAMHFVSPEAFTEHCIIYHNPFHAPLLHFNIPEQMKPTDLSVSRKTSYKRTIGGEQKLPKKKFKLNENMNSNSKQYTYPTPLMCNLCFAPFSNIESLEAHFKSHFEDTKRGLLGGAILDNKKRLLVEYTCPHCRSIFTSTEEISQHLMSHFLAIGTTYSCETCHKPFEKMDELQKHLIETHSHSLYSCSICKDVFETKVNLQVHLASKHSTEAKIYRCTGCPLPNNIFNAETEFISHIKTIHSSNPLLLSIFGGIQNSHTARCMICFRGFSNELELQLHLATHSKQFQCSFCPQTFFVEYLLEKHVQTHHSPQLNNNHDQDSGVKDLSPRQSPGSGFGSPTKKLETGDPRLSFGCCDICDKKEFISEIDFIHHKEMHRRTSTPRKSPNDVSENSGDQYRNCNSSSPSRNHNKKQKEENYCDKSNNNVTDCEICERHNFSSEAELRSHKLIHEKRSTSESDVKRSSSYSSDSNCNVCDDRSSPIFETNSSFECSECHLKFESSSEIEIHSITVHRKNFSQINFVNEKDLYSRFPHEGLNGYECRLCHVVLPNGVQLQIHLIEHNFLGCTAFPCFVCGAVFNSVQTLQGHIQDHDSAARPYRCSRCDQKFFFPSELEHHNYLHLDECQKYFYSPDKGVHKEKSSFSPLPLSDSAFNSKAGSKYNCSDCKLDFRQSNDYYEHRNHFHIQNFKNMSKEDHKRRLLFPDENNTKDGDSSENQNLSTESDDEQIDVVTTKTEELSVENDDIE